MYVLKLTDQTTRRKALILKRKDKSMERLLDGFKEFVEEKNGMDEVKEDGKI